jgi:hypothetical protein
MPGGRSHTRRTREDARSRCGSQAPKTSSPHHLTRRARSARFHAKPAHDFEQYICGRLDAARGRGANTAPHSPHGRGARGRARRLRQSLHIRCAAGKLLDPDHRSFPQPPHGVSAFRAMTMVTIPSVSLIILRARRSPSVSDGDRLRLKNLAGRDTMAPAGS